MLRTAEQVVEQFRAGEFIDTVAHPGFIALKHVQALGHVEVEGQHVTFVFTVSPYPLPVLPFATAAEAQAFLEQCAEACPDRKRPVWS